MTISDDTHALRLRAGVALRLSHRDPAVSYEVDCRMLFMGERLAAVERAYREVSECFASSADPVEVRRRLEESAEIHGLYEIGDANGSVSVTLRDEIFRAAADRDALELVIELGDARSRVRRPLSPRRLRALGALLPALLRGSSRAAIETELRSTFEAADFAWAVELFTELEETGLVVADREAPSFFARPAALPRVTLLGHSSLLVESERGAVLVDPVIRKDQRVAPEAFDVMRLRLDGIVLSHAHWDHCDLQTLLWFDKRTPIVIPRHRESTIFNPPIRSALALLGFEDVREADPWSPVALGDFEIVPVPFRGEQDEPGAAIDHFTYVIRTRGLTIYGGVDSYEDSFGSMLPELERVREDYRPDVAFLPISKMVYEYRHGGVNGFCRFVDRTLYDRSFQYTGSADDAARWVAALRPQWVCPYAIFAFPRWSMNPEIADFALALERVGHAQRFFPLRPLDAIDRRDLADLARTRRRRRVHVAWCFLAARLRRADWRFHRWGPYRWLRRAARSAIAWRVAAA